MKKKPSDQPEGGLAPGLRRYLYFSAAVTGAAIMIIEILGAKMLAPYVGTSHFVWTAQIAVTLVALALGYYAGGRLADSSPKLSRLYLAIVGAAFYLALTVMFVEPVAYWSLQYKLAVGSLLASTFLFFVPLALLAMTCPFLIRTLAISLSTVGGNIGRLSAVSTIGSFVGTVLIGYVMVPYLPNSKTMFLTSAALMAVSAVYFAVWGRQSTAVAPAAAVMVIGLFLGYGGTLSRHQFENVDELFRGNSNFGQLQVMQNKSRDRRFYLNDFLTQNTYSPGAKQSLSLFTYMLHELAKAYNEEVREALCIGLGVGIVPMQFARGQATVDVVEINPAVPAVAERFFDFDPKLVNLTIDDARHYLNENKKRYDAVVLDAFLGDSSPSHLMSREAFQAVHRALKDQGVLVINAFGDFTSGRDYFTASLEKTLKDVFPSVLIHASGNGNVFFVASPKKELKLLHEPDLESVHPATRLAVKEAFASLKQSDPSHGIVVTDDYNPIEFYDAANREQFRRYMANFMKSL